MADIQFERRGRPLWLVVLVALVVGGGGFYEYTSCHALRANRTLEPATAPAAPVVAPAAPTPAPAARP